MARNPNRGRDREPARDYNKKYTDKDRPSGWYQVEGKGKRWWNSYTNKWTRSPVGSTDDMIRKAHSEGRITSGNNSGSPRSSGRTTKKDKEKPTTTTSGPKRQPGATGGRGKGTSTYKVSGITYDSATGRPVVVPKNRQPVQAQDRTQKDPPAGGGGSSSGSSGSSGGSSSSSNSSSTPTRRPTGQGSQGFRKGDQDLGKATGIKASGSKTEPAKPKSRLEKALSGIGKWEEPKEKPKRNKPTSRFLKKTNNTRRKER